MSEAKLNSELDAFIAGHNTCHTAQSTDLFRRYMIDDEVNCSLQAKQRYRKFIGIIFLDAPR